MIGFLNMFLGMGRGLWGVDENNDNNDDDDDDDEKKTK